MLVLTLAAATAAAAFSTPAHAAAGPRAAYAFSEDSGSTTADSTGAGHTATLTNASWSSGGKPSGSVVFNGTSSIAKVPDSSALDITTALTLEAWVKPAATSSGSRTLIAKERSG